MNQRNAYAVFLIAGLGLSGCATTPPPAADPAAGKSNTTVATSVPDTKQTPTSPASGNPRMESGSPLKVRVFYFDFDSAKVGADYATTLAAHAKFLSASKLKMRIEGHADERGSTEYNMSLGQKRSDAIRRALAALGAADGGIETISWGEAKPAVVGHDEAAWSKNRRVEIRYSDEN